MDRLHMLAARPPPCQASGVACWYLQPRLHHRENTDDQSGILVKPPDTRAQTNRSRLKADGRCRPSVGAHGRVQITPLYSTESVGPGVNDTASSTGKRSRDGDRQLLDVVTKSARQRKYARVRPRSTREFKPARGSHARVGRRHSRSAASSCSKPSAMW